MNKKAEEHNTENELVEERDLEWINGVPSNITLASERFTRICLKNMSNE